MGTTPQTPPQTPSQITSRTRIAAVLLAVLLALFVFLQACNRSEETPTATPRAGGVVEQTPQQAAAPPAEPTPTPTPEPTPVALEVGDVLTSTIETTLYAGAATSSSVLDVYVAGAPFAVLEPAGAFTEYPVTAGGVQWVRVRAGDGLAGWAKVEALLPDGGE